MTNLLIAFFKGKGIVATKNQERPVPGTIVARTQEFLLGLLTYQSEYVSMDSCPQCRLLSAIYP